MYTLHDCFVTEVFVYVQATKASWEPNRSDVKNEHSEVWKLKFAHKKKQLIGLKIENKTKQNKNEWLYAQWHTNLWKQFRK